MRVLVKKMREKPPKYLDLDRSELERPVSRRVDF